MDIFKKQERNEKRHSISMKMIGLLILRFAICLPLYPVAGILMFITLYINFKSEKVIMFWSNVKPKTGGGGGNLSFFLKFFDFFNDKCSLLHIFVGRVNIS